MKYLGLFVILLSATVTARAVAVAAPEIDANSAVSGIALVAGGLMVLRGRRR